MWDDRNILILFSGYVAQAFCEAIFCESNNYLNYYCRVLVRVTKQFELLKTVGRDIAGNDFLK